MDMLPMTDHLRKLAEEPSGAWRRAFAGSALAILVVVFLAVALASTIAGGERGLPHAGKASTTEYAR